MACFLFLCLYSFTTCDLRSEGNLNECFDFDIFMIFTKFRNHKIEILKEIKGLQFSAMLIIALFDHLSSLNQLSTTYTAKDKAKAAATRNTDIWTNSDDSKASKRSEFHVLYHKIQKTVPTIAPTTT